MGGVGARPIWAPPRFSAKWDGRWRTGRATVIDGAYLRGHAPGRHLDSRATGVGACAVNYTRGSIDPVRPRVTFDATFVQTEERKAVAFENERRLARQERVPFQPGGSNKCIERGQLFLEYVGVNREIDREMGSLKKRPMTEMTEIDTLPPGPIASRHTGHARPTSLVFPPSVTCSTNSTTHQASFVQSRGGSP